MAPQASKKYGLLAPDHQQIGCCTSNSIDSETVPGTFSLLTISLPPPQASAQIEGRLLTPLLLFRHPEVNAMAEQRSITKRQLLKFTAQAIVSAGVLTSYCRSFADPIVQPGNPTSTTPSGLDPHQDPTNPPTYPTRPLTPGTKLTTFPKSLDDLGAKLQRDPTRLVLSFKNPTTKDTVRAKLQGFPLLLEDDLPVQHDPQLARLRSRINQTLFFYWVRSQNGGPIQQPVVDAVEASLHASLHWFGPVYQIQQIPGRQGLRCALPNIFQVLLVADSPSQALTKPFLLEFEVDGIKYLLEEPLGSANSSFARITGRRHFHLKEGNQYPVYKLVEHLRTQTDSIREVQLEYLSILSAFGSSHLPSDAYYAIASAGPIGPQWNLDGEPSTSPQIHVGGPENQSGWALTKGSSNIAIALIDQGCDITHPELSSCWYNPDQAAVPGATFSIGMETPGGAEDVAGIHHGTKCAGILAASHNTVGVAGVAPNCKILPLKLISNGSSATEIARALYYAADKTNYPDVRVISMSFGADWYLTSEKKLISDAIDVANLRGIVLCAASMNDNKAYLYFPAEYPNVIACGATSRSKKRCEPTDWGTNLGSNYGMGLSVVAPGNAIPTTTRQGSGSGSSQNYFNDFWGTSAATPHVAALAALILSRNPYLTPLQVRNCIEQTAQKVGGYTYDSSGWNIQVGFGLINVRAALCMASACLTDSTAPGSPTNLRVQ